MRVITHVVPCSPGVIDQNFEEIYWPCLLLSICRRYCQYKCLHAGVWLCWN